MLRLYELGFQNDGFNVDGFYAVQELKVWYHILLFDAQERAQASHVKVIQMLLLLIQS